VEFLELVETLRAEESRPITGSQLFGNEGIRLGRRQENPEYQRRLAEAARFVADVYTGRRTVARLQEAMTTSDFPLLFGDILDRQLLGAYAETPSTIGAFITMKTVRDFRPSRMFTIDGAESTLSPVGQREEYPMAALTEGRYQFTVSKYGRVVPFSWETMINDDLDALKDIPERLGRASRRSEEKFGVGLFVTSAGPDSTFFSAANNNILIAAESGGVLDNPPLSIAALQEAMILLSKARDSEGEPIVLDMVTLVVPPALEIVAQNILNAIQLELNTNGGNLTGLANSGGLEQRLIVQNWMRNRLRLVVNHYLPVIDTTTGNTAWYLFASPGTSRPALVMAKLRGHENPEMFMKSPNAVRIGGGDVSPMDGDFDTDSIEYKVRHVFGGTQIDPKGAIASTGTGSA
jgi:hypothetical protein